LYKAHHAGAVYSPQAGGAGQAHLQAGYGLRAHQHHVLRADAPEFIPAHPILSQQDSSERMSSTGTSVALPRPSATPIVTTGSRDEIVTAIHTRVDEFICASHALRTAPRTPSSPMAPLLVHHFATWYCAPTILGWASPRAHGGEQASPDRSIRGIAAAAARVRHRRRRSPPRPTLSSPPPQKPSPDKATDQVTEQLFAPLEDNFFFHLSTTCSPSSTQFADCEFAAYTADNPASSSGVPTAAATPWLHHIAAASAKTPCQGAVLPSHQRRASWSTPLLPLRLHRHRQRPRASCPPPRHQRRASWSTPLLPLRLHRHRQRS
jgi:hypothetical protein